MDYIFHHLLRDVHIRRERASKQKSFFSISGLSTCHKCGYYQSQTMTILLIIYANVIPLKAELHLPLLGTYI